MIDVPGSVERSLGLVETQRVALWDERDPLVLESGEQLDYVEVAYETYGELDAAASNCVFVCHALTGDAHAAGHHGNPERRGWWDNLIGPGKPLDTDRLYIVCANLLGGCQGTTGPGVDRPEHGQAVRAALPALHRARPRDRAPPPARSTSASSGRSRRSADRSAACRSCSGRSTTPTSSAPGS